MTGFDDVTLEAQLRRRTVKWTLHPPDVLAAWVAEMDFPVAPVVRAAVLDAVDREEFGYAAADHSVLSDACAAFMARRYGWSISPNRVFPVADVLEGIGGALDLHSPAGCAVVVPTPAYPPFFAVVARTGRVPVEVPLLLAPDERWVLDLERIDAALGRGARAVLLCNPQNPTGTVFGRDELAALAAVVDRHGARVVSDELHAPLVYPGGVHVPYPTVSDAAAGHAVVVTSVSKAWNVPGLKCAQVLTPARADADTWRARPDFAVPDPTPIGVAAAVAAYSEGEPWLAELLAYLDGNRHHLAGLLAAELPGVGYRPPGATYLAWLDCTALGLDDPAGWFLAHARVALNDGPPFGAGAQRCVRLNFGTSRALLDEIVGRMGAARR
ncbi:MAG: aminotransferase class I/II-fold pyridoxal phosphate-dependent enzyme [Actinobacteria bacterium]|nr:aminotransferase class I/II-fold pyridoxal phosphate-dependent enzyme [Actinomycetota bacterium]